MPHPTQHRIPVALDPPYAAEVEPGLLPQVGERVRAFLPPGANVMVITAPPIRRLWGATLEAGLATAALPFQVLELPDGEAHKTLADLESLAEAMVAHGADRHSLLLAFGGGVVGDVGAFLASMYMRGISLVHIPTTLLAMVDSSLGGKTGVNLRAGKNLLGSFYHPRAILADPDVLQTLADREYRSGLAEAIKYGIIADRPLFDAMAASASALRRRDLTELGSVIPACLRHKAAIVAADERESGRRQTLNFGHTLGHALESATGYGKYLHGEAVAWGMIAAARIAVRLRRLPEAESQRLAAAVLALCGPLPPLSEDPDLLLRHAARDKKARAGVLHFILPTAIGAVEVVPGVPVEVIRAALTDAVALTAAPAPAEQ
ncbi:MAG TPA: 3-dehydroquinate synthase [Terriglobales bacterium]|nr:3-dehydroquinate synthase [Terriglobales bacterium]